MTEEEMADVFSLYGHGKIYEKLKYPLYVSGELDEVDRDKLESFFSWYSFDGEKPVFFDDFIYHFRLFQTITDRNILPEIY
ncbi:hypothetical protein A8F94_19025 [Bacillus sp. FJAT-27225]|uniref:hypothetical protein n=1 Tax=Bacillus sp. FJAT-27225 TaxID=1743144 RepID=UPI00080C26AB|nr:hypothetical protein [Bacillus sp. FJAT-27225]OCA83206.1 hypothetical protein A8F94_19025 [Bacillus sp. FJAT-27225]